MIVLISGASHTGKTVLSQRLLEKYKMPYISLDHLKMGMIRSGHFKLSVQDDEKITVCLWPIVKEIIKTALENKQNLIIEGCYIPFDWQKDFEEKELTDIKFFCLIMTKNYIENNYSKISEYESIIETRLIREDIDKLQLIDENERNFRLCRKYGLNSIVIDTDYDFDISL